MGILPFGIAHTIMDKGQLKQAAFGVWSILSLLMLGMILSPFVFSPKRITSSLPACEWKVKYHRECPFCGLTRAFIAIRRGRFERAYHSNRASLGLYALFLFNGLGFISRLLRALKKALNKRWLARGKMTEEGGARCRC